MCQSAMSASLSWAHKSCPLGTKDKQRIHKQLCTELGIIPEQETRKGLIPPHWEHKGAAQGLGSSIP